MKNLLKKMTASLLSVLMVVSMMMTGVVSSVSAASGLRHEINSSGDVFLGGNYIEVGVRKEGSFGTKSTPKSTGWHYQDLHDGEGPFLGLVADSDGWDVGNDPVATDYFSPGWAGEVWALRYDVPDGDTTKTKYIGYDTEPRSTFFSENGVQLADDGQFDTKDTSGTIDFDGDGNVDEDIVSAQTTCKTTDGVSIKITVYFGADDLEYKTKVEVEDTNKVGITNVYFTRSFDPDQGAGYKDDGTERSDGYSYTYNRVFCNPDINDTEKGQADNYALVIAEDTNKTGGFFLSFDKRAKASTYTDGSYSWKGFNDSMLDIIYNNAGKDKAGNNLQTCVDSSNLNASYFKDTDTESNLWTYGDNCINITTYLNKFSTEEEDEDGNTTTIYKDETEYITSLNPDVAASLKGCLSGLSMYVDYADKKLVITKTGWYKVEYSKGTLYFDKSAVGTTLSIPLSGEDAFGTKYSFVGRKINVTSYKYSGSDAENEIPEGTNLEATSETTSIYVKGTPEAPEELSYDDVEVSRENKTISVDAAEDLEYICLPAGTVTNTKDISSTVWANAIKLGDGEDAGTTKVFDKDSAGNEFDYEKKYEIYSREVSDGVVSKVTSPTFKICFDLVSDVEGVNANTNTSEDGSITNFVSSKMKYKLYNGSYYKSKNASTVTGLVEGKYNVRYQYLLEDNETTLIGATKNVYINAEAPNVAGGDGYIGGATSDMEISTDSENFSLLDSSKISTGPLGNSIYTTPEGTYTLRYKNKNGSTANKTITVQVSQSSDYVRYNFKEVNIEQTTVGTYYLLTKDPMTNLDEDGNYKGYLKGEDPQTSSIYVQKDASMEIGEYMNQNEYKYIYKFDEKSYNASNVKHTLSGYTWDLSATTTLTKDNFDLYLQLGEDKVNVNYSLSDASVGIENDHKYTLQVGNSTFVNGFVSGVMPNITETITATDASDDTQIGSISGVTEEMQYSTDESTWKDVKLTSGVCRLAAGSYYFRYKEKTFTSSDATWGGYYNDDNKGILMATGASTTEPVTIKEFQGVDNLANVKGYAPAKGETLGTIQGLNKDTMLLSKVEDDFTGDNLISITDSTVSVEPGTYYVKLVGDDSKQDSAVIEVVVPGKVTLENLNALTIVYDDVEDNYADITGIQRFEDDEDGNVVCTGMEFSSLEDSGFTTISSAVKKEVAEGTYYIRMAALLDDYGEDAEANVLKVASDSIEFTVKNYLKDVTYTNATLSTKGKISGLNKDLMVVSKNSDLSNPIDYTGTELEVTAGKYYVGIKNKLYNGINYTVTNNLEINIKDGSPVINGLSPLTKTSTTGKIYGIEIPSNGSVQIRKHSQGQSDNSNWETILNSKIVNGVYQCEAGYTYDLCYKIDGVRGAIASVEVPKYKDTIYSDWQDYAGNTAQLSANQFYIVSNDAYDDPTIGLPSGAKIAYYDGKSLDLQGYYSHIYAYTATTFGADDITIKMKNSLARPDEAESIDTDDVVVTIKGIQIDDFDFGEDDEISLLNNDTSVDLIVGTTSFTGLNVKACDVKLDGRTITKAITTEHINASGKGKINGLTTDMEYKEESSSKWITATSSTAYVPGGNYLIRYAATDNTAAGPTIKVNVHSHDTTTTKQSNYVAATCTTAGSYDETVYCAVCEEKISSSHHTIAALGHAPVTDYGYAATGSSTGLTNGSHCSRCGTTLVAQQTIAIIPNAVGYTYTAGATECRIITNTDASRTVAYKNKQSKTKYQTIGSTVTLNGQTFTVTALKRDAVNGAYVRTLTLASTITNWEYGAFNGNNRLTKINVTSTTLNVENGAFAKMKASAKRKLKVYVTKKMSKKAFNALKAQLVREGLKASNIRRM